MGAKAPRCRRKKHGAEGINHVCIYADNPKVVVGYHRGERAMNTYEYLKYLSDEELQKTKGSYQEVISTAQETLDHIMAELERRQGPQAHEASAVESLRVLVSASHTDLYAKAIFELSDEIKALRQEIQIIKEPCWTPPQPEEKPKREYTEKDGCYNCKNHLCLHFGSQNLTAICGGHVWIP